MRLTKGTFVEIRDREQLERYHSQNPDQQWSSGKSLLDPCVLAYERFKFPIFIVFEDGVHGLRFWSVPSSGSKEGILRKKPGLREVMYDDTSVLNALKL